MNLSTCSPASLQTQFASLKRQAEANIRGSKLLEEKQSVGDAAADLVKSYIRNMNAKIPKLHRTPSSARSLLQDDEYEFKWADTSSACQSTLRDAGNTDIAALDAMDSSDDADIPWPADLAPCKGVLDITLWVFLFPIAECACITSKYVQFTMR